MQQNGATPGHTQSAAHPEHQPATTWGLTQEAQYFAELDSEELLEDGQDQPEDHHRNELRGYIEQACLEQGGARRIRDNQAAMQQSSDVACSSHMAAQTPDAVALARYHPDLQVIMHVTS